MKLVVSLILSVLMCGVLPSLAGAVPPVGFAPHVDYATGDAPRSAVIADLNRDGKLDVVGTNFLELGAVSVSLGNGDGSFGSHTEFATGSGPIHMATADLNRDGKLDVVTANRGANTVSVLLGNGDGSFGAYTDLTVGNYPYQVALGDLNGDGKPDIVSADTDINGSGTTVSLLFGNGDGSFQPRTTLTGQPGPLSVAIADLNGDGKPDLVVGMFASPVMAVFLGNGDGTFGSATTFPVAFTPYFVRIADLNGDAKLDVVESSFYGNAVATLMGNGDGSFGSMTVIDGTTNPYEVRVSDLNGDSKPDILFVNNGSHQVTVRLGNGDGSFEPGIHFAAGTDPASVDVADLNRDGKLDLVTANATDNTISVLLNNIVCGVLDVTASPPPSDQLSLSAYPNPTTGQTSVSFQLPKAGPVTIGIYDLLGRRLRQWDLATMPAGQHQVEWNGLAEDGHRVPPGVLFYQLTAAGHTLKQKVIRMQ